jgi:hypothetical protein
MTKNTASEYILQWLLIPMPIVFVTLSNFHPSLIFVTKTSQTKGLSYNTFTAVIGK